MLHDDVPQFIYLFSTVTVFSCFRESGKSEQKGPAMRFLAGVMQAALTMLSPSSLPPLALGTRRLVLLRHGQTDWNARGKMQGGGFDIELNDSGREQAAAVAAVLRQIPLDVVASSHLARASQTADIIHPFHPSAVRVSKREFGEMRFGQFEGTALRGPESTEEMRTEYELANSQLLVDVHAKYPGGGESTFEVATRAKQGLDALLADYPHAQTICVVAHGRTNKILLAALLMDDILDFDKIQQDNTCVNVLDMEPGAAKWIAHVLNSVEHTQRRCQ